MADQPEGCGDKQRGQREQPAGLDELGRPEVRHGRQPLQERNPAGGKLRLGLPFAPRALRTPLIERLEYDPGTVDPAVAGPELLAAVRAGGGEDHLPFAGQSVELIHDVLPAAEVVRRLMDEAGAALRAGARLAG